MDADSLNIVRRALKQRLESLQRAGVTQIGRATLAAGGETSPEADQSLPSVAVQPHLASVLPATKSDHPAVNGPTASIGPTVPPLADAVEESLMPRGKKPPTESVLPQVSVRSLPYPAGGPRTIGDKINDFAAVADVVAHCTLCKELAATRTQTVFGVGNVNARVAFFGEAPGADEDRVGEPFIGRAGQLLTKIIEACGWRREDVYILNVLKCRPPDNRTPLPPEVDNCRQYFQRQFEVIRPEFIVCAGAIPAQALLETTEAVGKLRGRFHQYRDSKVLVTYHPAYLLRNPAAKKFVWDDMQILLKEMGLPIPGKKSE
jgi:uracil-DNA glycosylase family 4